ncbi:hypothetical protein FA15DRAFT_688754 [Coprinopsis marcescibilis]|uniref:SnoaL-like domain-containing protein n=1 Tax=Coprinopsis marcescibilis TaxID=230819 RepID=A0A5C3KM27_COPMA|nr:hypothetical protein FA15DRAFT_688754 [Coprinopsis marcescibilis]
MMQSFRLIAVALTLCLSSLGAVASPVAEIAELEVRQPPPGGPHWPPAVCNPNESGPHLQARQQAALDDFARLYFVERDIDTAFDRWVPGQYIRHNPNAEQGRHTAIPALKALWGNPQMTTSNRSWFAGEGYGMLHFKFRIGAANTNMAVVDKFRFQGTCIVEHWDVMQVITGNEPNPIAFF